MCCYSEFSCHITAGFIRFLLKFQFKKVGTELESKTHAIKKKIKAA